MGSIKCITSLQNIRFAGLVFNAPLAKACVPSVALNYMSKFCQSCGMPLNKDPQNGGTDSDGIKSTEFCSLCYKDGNFIDDCKTAKEMQKFCIQKLNESGMPKLVAWLFTRGIPRLKRWSI